MNIGLICFYITCTVPEFTVYKFHISVTTDCTDVIGIQRFKCECCNTICTVGNFGSGFGFDSFKYAVSECDINPGAIAFQYSKFTVDILKNTVFKGYIGFIVSYHYASCDVFEVTVHKFNFTYSIKFLKPGVNHISNNKSAIDCIYKINILKVTKSLSSINFCYRRYSSCIKYTMWIIALILAPEIDIIIIRITKVTIRK